MGRKILVLTISMVLFFQIASAQQFQGGLRGGLVASEVAGDNLGGPNKLGWFASAFTFVEITDYTDLMLEIMYIRKGSKSVPNERNNFYEYKFNLQYVEVPLHYRMDISRYTDITFLDRLKVNAGLSLSVVVDYLETDMGTPVPAEEREDFHPAELNILLGFSFPLSSSLDFNFGFSNSLTPIRPHAGGGRIWYNRGQYNTLWTFGVSYVFW